MAMRGIEVTLAKSLHALWLSHWLLIYGEKGLRPRGPSSPSRSSPTSRYQSRSRGPLAPWHSQGLKQASEEDDDGEDEGGEGEDEAREDGGANQEDAVLQVVLHSALRSVPDPERTLILQKHVGEEPLAFRLHHLVDVLVWRLDVGLHAVRKLHSIQESPGVLEDGHTQEEPPQLVVCQDVHPCRVLRMAAKMPYEPCEQKA
eukprot:CAMPEP_0170616760 /NCGR_PEP_ID=MMETSP0224-20130122/26040_1 /TAXON_ID=285029 /ORGANISM="Togula jolla, Strain CCCM 725" /LENGTH=201 /DNA_ID=CAMNT_0010942575 /DNA_START=93 /DNA_END=699 /DNA_ORIENTATION=-